MPDVILRNAMIVTMDDALGDYRKGDLHIRDDVIAAIGPSVSIAAEGAEEVDMSGRILLPGMINAHMHTWQTGLRGIAANWTIPEYFKRMHAGLATAFTPVDIHIATLVGAYNQLNCGVTSLVDWCHNNPTPDHSDAAIDALLQSGIRATFFHGTPKPDPLPGQPHFSEIPHPRHEVARLAAGRLSAPGSLVGLGLAILGPHYSTLAVARHDLTMAREFGLVASMHQGGGDEKSPGGWEALDEDGLLGPWVNIVHGNDLSDARLDLLVKRGASFSITPEGELTQGHGFPIVGRLRERGVAPSLGGDLESLLPGDMFSVARMALAAQRGLDNAHSRQLDGRIPDTSTITVREALSWVTVEGARMMGLSDRIGTLTPGKQADIVAIDARALNMVPVHDPVASIVMQAGLANVEAVLVSGQWRKRDGRMIVADLQDRLEQLDRSGHRIAAAAGLR
jgi:cytosine/adenosine deaminase-related metal-dependent hydrolase